MTSFLCAAALLTLVTSEFFAPTLASNPEDQTAILEHGVPSSDSFITSGVIGEVEERFSSLARAARSLDHKAYFSHFNQDAMTALNSDGTITPGFDQFSADYLAGVAGLASYRKLSFAKVAIQPLSKDAAILVNEYVAEVELVDGTIVNVSGAGLQVWQRTNGVWKIVHVSSSIKP